MDKKSKILLSLLGLAIVISVGATYWRIMIKKDYIISSQVDCDPTIEKCFIWECDSTLAAGEDEACTGDPEEDVWYYKIAERKANNIPLCDPNKDETCQPFLCEEGEADCQETLCDETTVAEGESCNNPEEYLKNNPEEAEAEDEEGEEELEGEEDGEESLSEDEEAAEENGGSETEEDQNEE